MAAGKTKAPDPEFIAFSHSENLLKVYRWTESGFGSLLSTVNTSSQPGKVTFNPSGTALAVTVLASPFIRVWPVSTSGVGSQYSNPSTALPNSAQKLAWAPNGSAVVITTTENFNAAPTVHGYVWNNSTGFGSKFSNPTSVFTNDSYDCAFSPNGANVAAVCRITPFIRVWAWSASGFGALRSNPSTLPTNNLGDGGNGVAFSPDGSAIAVVHAGSPFVSVYPWTGTAFGAKFSDPSVLPHTKGGKVKFSQSGSAIALSTLNGATYASFTTLMAYQWSSSGFGAKYSNPSPRPTGMTDSGSRGEIAFNVNGNAIAIGHGDAPHISVYGWDANGFGSRYSAPESAPTTTVRGVAFGKQVTP